MRYAIVVRRDGGKEMHRSGCNHTYLDVGTIQYFDSIDEPSRFLDHLFGSMHVEGGKGSVEVFGCCYYGREKQVAGGGGK